jgi:LacI family transcriptional regulator
MMPVTMRDVARKAEVSIKTVSRVVNNQGEISEETRQRVLSVIKELGYRPNMVARGLITQRTYTIGVVFGDILNPFFPSVARGIQDMARQHNYNVFFSNTDQDVHEQLHVMESLVAHGVDGIIISPMSETGLTLNAFADQFRPIVSINHHIEHRNVSMIMVDGYKGGQLAVNHFVAQGHTQIGSLIGHGALPSRGQRLQGFCNALQAHGLPLIESHIIFAKANIENGYKETIHLLAQHPEITAIFAYNDMFAIGALQACRQLGRRVPQDCAIIGFDDIETAALVTPALTTIHVDKYELGQQAMTRLLAMLDDPETLFPPLTLEVKLMQRESA